MNEELKNWIFENGMWCCPYCGGAESQTIYIVQIAAW